VRSAPEPVLPDFDGPCLTNIVPALLGALEGSSDQPDWLPAAVVGARQVVLLVLDGLGAEQLATHRGLAPTLVSGGPVVATSVAPSTTATAVTSLVTGLPPAVHGIVGYRMALDGQILNVLRWQYHGRDARTLKPPARFQPFPAFPGSRGVVPVVSRADYAVTGFSAAHLGNSELHGWHVPSSIPLEVRHLLDRGDRFVYAYYDGIDRVAHATGLGDHYQFELRSADHLVADVLEVLPPGAALVVTADHGQVEVGQNVEVLGSELMDAVVLMSGEGRFRWLHLQPGAADDVAAAAQERYGTIAWVRTREQVIEEGWLGGEPVPEVADRLGDVVLVPFEATAFLDPADTGELRLVARHGSLTPSEMLVPLLGWSPPGG
jgi:predicted AlkP superfamily pyrophosphatase or phosphodiesterase